MTIPKRAATSRKPVVSEALDGARWILANRTILQLAIMLGFINMFSIMMFTMLVLYSQDVLGLSAAGHGTLLAFAAAGGVLGGILCPKISARIGNRRSLMVALALMPIPPLILAIFSNVAIAAVMLFVEMFTAILWNVVTVSYRQRMIPDDLLGRVNAIYRFFGWGMMPVGALLGGTLTAWFEPSLGREDALQTVFMLSAAGLACVMIYGWARLRI